MKRTVNLIGTCLIAAVAALLGGSCMGQPGYKERLLTKTEQEPIRFDVDSLTGFICRQYRKSLDYLGQSNRIPRNSYKDGTMRTVGIKDWCSGFYGGSLWYVYELTRDTSWIAPADYWTEQLRPIQYYEGIHDIGFMVYCSYGNGYRLTQRTDYLPVLEQTASTLCKRFNVRVGTLLSWGDLADTLSRKYHNTIIDNMMNLELLTFAAETFGDRRSLQIARAHADRTMQSHVRPDFSTFYVVEYDKRTGNIIHQKSHQGYSDSSDWARGQSWAIYGYRMMYEHTGDRKYLDVACCLADHYISRLPEDLVPYWDFDDPAVPDTYRDASAGAVSACALFDLSRLTEDPARSLRYRNIAVGMVNSLTTGGYLATEDYYKCLLLHSVGHWNKKTEIDANINYADYYYLEALLKVLGLYGR